MRDIVGFIIKFVLAVIIIGMFLSELEDIWWQKAIVAVVVYGMISFIVNCFLNLGIFGLIPVIGYVAFTDVVDNMVILVIVGVLLFGGSVVLDFLTIKSLFMR